MWWFKFIRETVNGKIMYRGRQIVFAPTLEKAQENIDAIERKMKSEYLIGGLHGPYFSKQEAKTTNPFPDIPIIIDSPS